MFDIEDTAVLVLAPLLTRADPAGHTVPTGGRGDGGWRRERGGQVSRRPLPPPSEHKSTCLNPPDSLPPPKVTLSASAALPVLALSLSQQPQRAAPSSGCGWRRAVPRSSASGPSVPPSPSSFTVTWLERNRSKQTCGGREFPRMMDRRNQGLDGAIPLVEAALE